MSRMCYTSLGYRVGLIDDVCFNKMTSRTKQNNLNLKIIYWVHFLVAILFLACNSQNCKIMTLKY